MSNGERGRGLVFFALIGLCAVGGGVALWKLRGSRSGVGDTADEGAGARSGLRLVKGAGTTWMDDEGAGDLSGVLEGVVLDGSGQPVDGAAVALGRARGRHEDVGPGFSYMEPRGLATTAGGGRFRIEKLQPGDYAATAAKDGWAPGRQSGIAIKAKETTRVELRLAPGGLVLSGRVLDVGGGAVPGAKITAASRAGGFNQAPVLFRVVTDAEGKYQVTLARGNYGLRVEAEGYAAASEDVYLVRATTKDLRLVPAARLSGRVVERGTKQPVPEAEVSLTSASRMDFKPPRETRADASGQFTLTGLEPGTYEVMGRRGALIGAGKVVALAVAQTVDGIEIEVDRGYTISGRIKDDKGAPVVKAQLYASRTTPPFGQAARTRTNPDGTYALEGMLPGNYRVGVWEEGYGQGYANTRVLAADVANVDITLPAAVKVTGKVMSAAGQPVEGARVQAQIESRVGGMNLTGGDYAVTGPDGAFELKRVGAGRLTVTARHDELGAERLPTEEVRTGESKVLNLVLKKGGSVAGVIKGEDGRPAANVRVAAIVRSGFMSSLDAQDVSGPDGRYRIPGLPAGQVIVVANRTGRFSWGSSDEPHQKNLTLADNEDKSGVDLVVPDAGLSVQGTAVSAEGKPVPGAIVTAGLERNGRAFPGGGRGQPKAYSGLDGQFTLEDLGKGTFTLWASHPDFPDAELKGVASGSTGVSLKFPADTTVSGVVVSPEGKPIPHYTLTILPGPTPDEKPEEKRRRQMNAFNAPTQRVQDPGGAFELRRLAGGSHELVVTTAAGESATQVVAVQAGEKKTGVRIQVVPGVRITGKVVEYGTNKPIEGGSVSAMGAGNARTETTCGPDGSFVLEGATTGESVQLFARGDDTQFVGESKALPLTAGQTTIDAGVIKLIRGNQRERFMVPPSERGQAGAFARLENGRLTFPGNPMPESAAQKAGLKKGDVLLSITAAGTTYDARELGTGAVSYLLSGKLGDQVELTVESPEGGGPRKISLVLEVYKPRPPPSAPATAAAPK